MDKHILITGATSGIGKATTLLCAEHNVKHLTLTGRRQSRLEHLKETLEKNSNTKVDILCFDVRDQQAVEHATSEINAPIDILINNAGLAQGKGPIHEGLISDWETMIDTNIKGLLYMTRAITPLMVVRGSGHVINVASTAGKEVYPGGNVYCATKHAVDALTKAMRIDLHTHGIKVSQVAPAHVEETEFAEVRFHGDKEQARIYNDFNPLKSRDVAEAILWIISRPPHVNVQDILLMGTQQASSNHIHRSGRIYD